MRTALEDGRRRFVWLEDLELWGPTLVDEFPGTVISIFGYGGPLTVCAHRKYVEPVPAIHSTRKDLWRLTWSGISFIEDDPRFPNHAPFVRFPRVDRSSLQGLGFYGSSGPAFEFGGDGDDEYFSGVKVSNIEVHRCMGASMKGTRKLTLGGRTSFERNGAPVIIAGDRDASADSTIRDVDLEDDDGRVQLEIRHLTNSRVEDVRLDECGLVGRDCGWSPRDLKLHGASTVDWPGASCWARRTWKRIPRNARGV